MQTFNSKLAITPDLFKWPSVLKNEYANEFSGKVWSSLIIEAVIDHVMVKGKPKEEDINKLNLMVEKSCNCWNRMRGKRKESYKCQ
jgi:hypothetical protein